MHNIKVKVLAFGLIADKLNASEFSMEGVTNTDDLQRMLFEAYPQLATLKFVVAVNQQIINQCTALAHDNEVALLPPFSGG